MRRPLDRLAVDSARDGPGAFRRGARCGRGRRRRSGRRRSTSPTTRATSCPGRSSSACAGRRATGTRSRRRRPRSGRSRSSSSSPSTWRCRSSSCRTSVRRCRVAATLFFGDPTRELDVAAITGTNGKTTSAFLLHAILEADGRRAGLLTNIERRVGGETQPTGLNTPEAIDLQRLFRQMVDAGDTACVMEATSIAQAQGRLDGTRFAVLVFTNLTQDHLDFHGSMEAYFEAKRALFAQAERAVVNVGDEYGRRLAAELPDAITFDAGQRRDRRDRAAAAGALQPRERDRRGARGARARRRRRRDPARDRVRLGRARPLRADRRGAAVHGDRRLRAHARLARQRACARARGLGDGRLVVVFGAGGDRDRDEAAADGPRRRRARRPRDPHLRQPARRGAGGDRGRGGGGRARRARDASSTAAPRSSWRSATHGRATSS